MTASAIICLQFPPLSALFCTNGNITVREPAELFRSRSRSLFLPLALYVSVSLSKLNGEYAFKGAAERCCYYFPNEINSTKSNKRRCGVGGARALRIFDWHNIRRSDKVKLRPAYSKQISTVGKAK